MIFFIIKEQGIYTSIYKNTLLQKDKPIIVQ
nr:MAG TPA: hypothetical protein [Caudoviricetes sp.]